MSFLVLKSRRRAAACSQSLRQLHHYLFPPIRSFLRTSPPAKSRICRSLLPLTPNPCATVSLFWMAAQSATIPTSLFSGADRSPAPASRPFTIPGFTSTIHSVSLDYSAPFRLADTWQAFSLAPICAKPFTTLHSPKHFLPSRIPPFPL